MLAPPGINTLSTVAVFSCPYPIPCLLQRIDQILNAPECFPEGNCLIVPARASFASRKDACVWSRCKFVFLPHSRLGLPRRRPLGRRRLLSAVARPFLRPGQALELEICRFEFALPRRHLLLCESLGRAARRARRHADRTFLSRHLFRLLRGPYRMVPRG